MMARQQRGKTMILRNRILTSEHLQGLTRPCPDCGMTMTSNGEMITEDGGGQWAVQFRCPGHWDSEGHFDIWAPELEPIIQKALEGVDIAALPYRGELLLWENLQSGEAQNRAQALHDLRWDPTGDVRLLPLVEDLLKDKTPCRISAPYACGEIRWLAALALAAERFAAGRPEPVHLHASVAPLVWEELATPIEIETQIRASGDMRPAFTRLRAQGLLPVHDFEFPSIQDLNYFEEHGRVLPLGRYDGNKRDAQRLLEKLQSRDTEGRAEALGFPGNWPTGDARVLPLLEDLLEDRTPCNIWGCFYAYVEVRWVAAHALAAELFAGGPYDPVRVPEVVAPLVWHELMALRQAAHIPPPHVNPATGLENVLETFTLLHDRGLLPVYDIEISQDRVRPI